MDGRTQSVRFDRCTPEAQSDEILTEVKSGLSSHKTFMGNALDTGELIQGTLEMLVLKAMARGRCTDMQWPSGYNRHRNRCSKWKRARCIRQESGCNFRAMVQPRYLT